MAYPTLLRVARLRVARSEVAEKARSLFHALLEFWRKAGQTLSVQLKRSKSAKGERDVSGR